MPASHVSCSQDRWRELGADLARSPVLFNDEYRDVPEPETIFMVPVFHWSDGTRYALIRHFIEVPGSGCNDKWRGHHRRRFGAKRFVGQSRRLAEENIAPARSIRNASSLVEPRYTL